MFQRGTRLGTALLKAALLAGLLLAGAGLWYLGGGIAGKAPETSVLTVAERMAARGGGGAAPDALSSRAIPAADLPPAGTRSLFDHHLARLGALPYPFSALLDSFGPVDRWGEGAVSLLIPDGRSLRKGQADFRQPRVLVAAQADAPFSSFEITPIYSGRLFLGFVEAADEIEIISYNEGAGRFEFQLVQDYCAGCVPRLVYARRAVCLACHQSGAPIFSQRPWGETNAHPPIARRVAKARNVPWLEASSTRYHGVPISTQLLMPETFDELVVGGAEIPVVQRIWLDGCGESGLECRRHLLGGALALLMMPGEFDPASPANQRVRALQRIAWPAEGIAVANNLLPSRDPLAERSRAGDLWRHLRAWLAGWRASRARGEAADPELAAKLAAFERRPKLEPALDPLSPRAPREILTADTLLGVRGLARMFSANDRSLLFDWGEADAGRLRELVLSGVLDDLLGPSPVNRVLIMQRLAEVLGAEVPDYCCLDAAAFSPPRAEGTPPLAITKGSPLELFRRYCFACHRGNPSQRLNFMGAKTEVQVLADIRAKSEIRDVLDYERYAGTPRQGTLMPPADSDQRARLDEARARGADDLRRMREEITPLFDF